MLLVGLAVGGEKLVRKKEFVFSRLQWLAP